MAKLTTWEADRGGYFQGTATPGQAVGRAIDWLLVKIGQLPKIPKPEPNKDHWSIWAHGEPIAITEAWIDHMIAEERLPSRDQVVYSGAHEGKAKMREMTGSHVIVEMLDTDCRTRHRCILLGNVLIAPRDAWEASIKSAL